jgi:hypothetical protein
VALLAVSVAVPAQADNAAKARVRVKKARTLYEQGKFDAAISEYQAAYALVQASDILFNMGQIAEVKGAPKQAIDFYLKYVRIEPEGRLAGKARDKLVELTDGVLPENIKPKFAAAQKAQPADLSPAQLDEKWAPFYGAVASGEGDLAALLDDVMPKKKKPKPEVITTVEPDNVIVEQPPPRRERKPLPPYARKWWFWTAIGGGAVLVLTIGLGAGLGGAKDPSPTLGVLK